MSKVTINGVDLEMNMFDADFIEEFESGCNMVVTRVKDPEEMGGLSTADAIRKQCSIVNDFFDGLFGEGTSEKIFVRKSDIMEHMMAFETIVNEKKNADGEMAKFAGKYSPNRAQRREAEKANKKSGK